MERIIEEEEEKMEIEQQQKQEEIPTNPFNRKKRKLKKPFKEGLKLSVKKEK